MCVGVPMRVLSCTDGIALCEGRGQRERLNLMLVGEQPEGTWVLAFQGSAVRVLEAREAAAIDDALDALAAVLSGASAVEGFFADLVGREPELPPHLRSAPS